MAPARGADEEPSPSWGGRRREQTRLERHGANSPAGELKKLAAGPSTHTSTPLRFVAMVALTMVAEIITMGLLGTFAPDFTGLTEALVDAVLLCLLVAGPAWFVVVGPLVRERAAETRFAESQRNALLVEVDRQEFDGRLHRALQMAEDEPDSVAVVGRALDQVSPDVAVSLLLADSPQAHLREAVAAGGVATAEGRRGGCAVECPRDCVASRRGRALRFHDSTALDACPRLAEVDGDPAAALCVPVNVGGRTVGVLHSVAPVHSPPPDALENRLQIIATQLGGRLSVVRAMAASQRAASTDPLTGLLNRRSLEDQVGELLVSERPFGVVMTDLDHFKKLNDEHSHAAGDRALRAFAATLRKSCRPDDLLARVGGEEFVLILPGIDSEGAARVVERVRGALPNAVLQAGAPPFTASFGVADHRHGPTLAALLRVADQALYAAKRTGRDRFVMVDEFGALPAEEAPARPVLAG